MFYKKLRMYTNRNNRRVKYWVPTKQKVADEAEKDPTVRKLWRKRMIVYLARGT